jgi:hypothetical protein
MKHFTLGILSLLTISASAQNLPTLVSYEIDTMCSNGNDFALVHTIKIQDLDMDSTYITIGTYDGADLYNVTAINPAYVPTATMRTFSIIADAGTGLSPGLNLSDITFTITGNPVLDGGITTGQVIDNVAVYGNLAATFDISTLEICLNANPIDLRAYASPLGVYQSFSWGTGDASYMFDPEEYYSEGGSSVSYIYKNIAGCEGFAVSSPPIINFPPSLSVSPLPSTCGNADGAISSFISGASPFQVYWSTGFAETASSVPSSLSNLPAGNYYMNVTDANGCKEVALAQVSDTEISISETYISESCKMDTEDGGIDLTITTPGTVNFIYWSNGQQTEDLTDVHYGEYTVEIRTDGGCEANKTYNVPVLTAMYADNVNSTDANCSSADGVVDYEIVDGSGSYSYLWNTGATTPGLFGVTSGSYSCLVTDLVTGCKLTYWHDVFAYGSPSAALNSLTKPTCGNSDGAINLDLYTWGAPITDIEWSSGQSTADIEGISAGEYELTLTAQDGCIFGHTFRITNAQSEKPSICLLTVDTSLIYNMIVWEKDPLNPNIAGYNIYRETSIYGEFEKVAYRPYALESFYQDNDASPVDRSWRYGITEVNTCNQESPMSFVHKTIHTITSTANSIDYDVHWDNYEGISYTSIYLLRYDATNGWVTVANLPYGTNVYTDTPPVIAGLDYLVVFILTDPCTSTKVQDHNSSRSNKSASIFMPGGSTAQIEDADLGVISIYPNPANDYFVIHIDQPESVQSYEILDLSGNLVNRGMIITNNTSIATDQMAAGIYMVKIYSADKVITQKLVLN